MDGEAQIRLTWQAAWAVPFVVAGGLGAAVMDQMARGDERTRYVVWPVPAAVVAAGSLVAAGRLRV